MYDSEKGFLNPPMSKAFSLLELLNASEYDLVAGTVFGTDAEHISLITAHWIYIQVKQGARKMKRIGNAFAEVLCPDEVLRETDIQVCTEYRR